MEGPSGGKGRTHSHEPVARVRAASAADFHHSCPAPNQPPTSAWRPNRSGLPSDDSNSLTVVLFFMARAVLGQTFDCVRLKSEPLTHQ